jgi:DNA-binding transcriptional LysR family regulator
MPREIHLAHSFSIAAALLSKTNMVSVFSWPLVEVSAVREKLCVFPLREQPEGAMVGVISRSGHPLRAASECFIECLIETIPEAFSSTSTQMRNVRQPVELLDRNDEN